MASLALTAQKLARSLRSAVFVISVLMSGWFLLYFWGLREEWIYGRGLSSQPLPPHAMVRMAAALIFGLALPFLAAWLIPSTTKDPTKPFYSLAGLLGSYPCRLIFSLLCALLVAIGFLAIGMILLDSGVG